MRIYKKVRLHVRTHAYPYGSFWSKDVAILPGFWLFLHVLVLCWELKVWNGNFVHLFILFLCGFRYFPSQHSSSRLYSWPFTSLRLVNRKLQTEEHQFSTPRMKHEKTLSDSICTAVTQLWEQWGIFFLHCKNVFPDFRCDIKPEAWLKLLFPSLIQMLNLCCFADCSAACTCNLWWDSDQTESNPLSDYFTLSVIGLLFQVV